MKNGNVRLPEITFLTLNDVSVFTSSNTLTSKFRMTWGNEYFDKASDTWALSINGFKNNSDLSMTLEEMIFCMEYDPEFR